MTSAPLSVSTLMRLILVSFGAHFVCSPGNCGAYETSTFCAWKRTWHGPNALATPLRGYYVPRMSGRCDRGDYAGGWGCSGSEDCDTGHVKSQVAPAAPRMYPPELCIGFEPVQFERLGQVPNDLELGSAAPVGAPGR
jgi:hypothetical protein